MKTFYLWLSVTALSGLSACTDSTPQEPAALSRSLIATHAFDVPSPVKQIAFSPNDVASWLGIVALITDDGTLMMTNIEGDAPRIMNPIETGGDLRVSGSKPMRTLFTDVVGISRLKAPAVFLALDTEGKLSGFIESDDNRNFKPMPIDGDYPRLASLCDDASGLTERMNAITQDGFVISLKIETSDAITLSPSGEREKADPMALCAANGADVYISSKGTLERLNGPRIKMETLTGISALPASPELIAVSTKAGAPLTLLDALTLEPRGAYAITSGLSIRGLEAAQALNVTRAPFGGASFNDGLIALSDANEARVVVVSRSYALEAIKP